MRWSLLLLVVFLGLGLVTVVLAALMRDQLVLNWAEGHRDAREYVAREGLDYLISQQPIAVPQFVPVAATLFVTMASLMGVLAMFYRGGHHWARVCLTVLIVMTAVATGSGIRVGAPTVFIVLSYVALGLVVALLVTMWHPATSEHLRGTRARVDAGAL
jgi:hypothetical protein